MTTKTTPAATPERKIDIDLPSKDGSNALVVREEGDEVAQGEDRSESATLIRMIERVARDPSVNVDRIERLMQMHREIAARNAEQAFNESMRAAQEEMPRVVRDAKNDSTNSKYARLETVSKRADPVIHKHGFSMSFGTADSPLPNHYRVTCQVAHIGGHSRNYQADIPADATGMKGNQNKTGTHAFGSTMSYGRRYLKLLIFDVTLVNEDDDGRGAGDGDPISQAETTQLLDLIESVGADVRKFCEVYRIDGISNLPAVRFAEAVGKLRKFGEQRKQK